MAEETPSRVADVPVQVFEQFLLNLAAANLPSEVISRLQKTLIEDGSFSEIALRKALFGEETLL